EMRAIGGDPFNMTVAGLRLSRAANAVSKLHGETARAMWKNVENACAIEAITNRSEEHTSELQSLTNLVCRLLLEKKKILDTGEAPLNTAFNQRRVKHRARLTLIQYTYRGGMHSLDCSNRLDNLHQKDRHATLMYD